ncbi:glycosyltransferase [Carnimonas bestiolae]|uniref:glycosyltransferase n=1 Tax=Carnimonas bestiolae TaxID=3402172 RepID=UPI003EDC0BD0
MKILYLITSLETGGAEFAVADIVASLQKQGLSVDVIACEPRDMVAATHLQAAGIPYRVLCSRRRASCVVLAKLLRYMRHHRPDIIWTSLSWATRIGQRAGQLLNIPVVSFKHSASVKRATYRMRHLSDLWVGDSSLVTRYLVEHMGIPADRVLNWPLYQCDAHATLAAPWDGSSTLQLGSVGRLHSVKQYDKLIEALARAIARTPSLARRLHLTIVGEGPERAALEQLIERLALQNNVSLPGFSNNVDAYLTSWHVYFQPSFYEGMCLAVHEAMNAGLPIVATPVGELTNCVQNGVTGFIAEGETVAALTEIILQIAAHPEQLAALGQQAHRYVQQHYSRASFDAAAHAIATRLSTLPPHHGTRMDRAAS